VEKTNKLPERFASGKGLARIPEHRGRDWDPEHL